MNRRSVLLLCALTGAAFAFSGCSGVGSSGARSVSTDPLEGAILGTYSEPGIATGTLTGTESLTQRGQGTGTATDDATHTPHSTGFASAGWTDGRVQTFTISPWIDSAYAVGTVERQSNGHFTGALTRYDASNKALSPSLTLDLAVKKAQ